MTLISGRTALMYAGDAGDQAAAADGDEDRVDRPLVLAQDLHPDRALPGDHVGIVERVHEGQAALGFERARVRVASE